MAWLLLLLVLVPFVELTLLVEIGARIGFLPTLAAVIGIGLVGATLAKREGLRVLRQWQEALARGQVPEEGVLSGLLVLVAGLLLVMPGLLTDVVGLVLLFPPTRKLVARIVRRRVERGIEEGDVHVVVLDPTGPRGFGGPFGPGPFGRGPFDGGSIGPGARRPAPPPGVIDVDGEDVSDPPSRLPGG